MCNNNECVFKLWLFCEYEETENIGIEETDIWNDFINSTSHCIIECTIDCLKSIKKSMKKKEKKTNVHISPITFEKQQKLYPLLYKII